MTPVLITLFTALGQAAPAPAAPPAKAQSSASQSSTSQSSTSKPDAGEEGELPVTESKPTALPSESPLDTLTRVPTVRPFQMPTMTPIAPVPYAPPAPQVASAPVPVDQYRRSYEGPKDANEQYYARGVAGAFQAEQ